MKIRLTLVLFSCALLCGCFPEERVWWSPQGDRAIVLVKDRLRVLEADGTLGPSLDGAGDQTDVFTSVDWLPDGSGFICSRERVVGRWEEVRALIPADEAAKIESLAPALQPLLEAAARMTDKVKSLEEMLNSMSGAQLKLWAAACQLAWQQSPAVIEKLLLALPEGEAKLKAVKGEGGGFHVAELCVFKLADPAKPKVLLASLTQPALVARISPKHPVIAYLHLDGSGDNASLEVMPLDGGGSLVIRQKVSAAYDWMPDGRTLVFAEPADGEGSKLQGIHFAIAVQESGAIMKPAQESQADGSTRQVEGPDRFAGATLAATVLMVNRPRLESLPDGRVLLACQPVAFPLIHTDAEITPRLFLLSADRKSIAPVPTGERDLPADLDSFVASPDGRHIAVIESATDAVAVVEIATGKTEIISPAHPPWECETVPAWRSASELTFAGLHGSTLTPGLMLWSAAGGTRCLSETWPTGSADDWLKKRQSANEQPPATPPEK